MDREVYWLLYDGDCRICRIAARCADYLDFRSRIRIQPIQQSRDFLGSIPGAEILDAMHMVSPGGHVTTGGDSLPTLLEALSSGPPLALRLRVSPTAMSFLNRVYAIIVELRGHLVCRFEPVGPLPPGDRSGNAGP